MKNYRKSFDRNSRAEKCQLRFICEPNVVIKRAISGSRDIGSRPLAYTVTGLSVGLAGLVTNDSLGHLITRHLITRHIMTWTRQHLDNAFVYSLPLSVKGWHFGLQALFHCHHPTLWTFIQGIEKDLQM